MMDSGGHRSVAVEAGLGLRACGPAPSPVRASVRPWSPGAPALHVHFVALGREALLLLLLLVASRCAAA